MDYGHSQFHYVCNQVKLENIHLMLFIKVSINVKYSNATIVVVVIIRETEQNVNRQLDEWKRRKRCVYARSM